MWYYLNTTSNNLHQAPFWFTALILLFCLLHCNKQRIKYSCLSYTESPQTGANPDSRRFSHTTSCVCPALSSISIQYLSRTPTQDSGKQQHHCKTSQWSKSKNSGRSWDRVIPCWKSRNRKTPNQQMAEHQLKSHLSDPQLSSTVINLPRQP